MSFSLSWLKPYLILLGCIACFTSLFAIAWIIFHSRRLVMTQSGYALYRFMGFEHRLVAQRALKRKLHANEVVHHIDGVRHNNRLDNLCVMHWRQHNEFHSYLWKKRKRLGRYPHINLQRLDLKNKFRGILLDELK